MLANRVGESDLVHIRGEWYLLTTAEVALEDGQPVTDVVGIDLGVTNIATDSDGAIHQAKTIKNVRYRHRQLRQKLQKKRTLGSRRRLRALAGQERRFVRWVNHNLSKQMEAIYHQRQSKAAAFRRGCLHVHTLRVVPTTPGCSQEPVAGHS